MKRSDLKLIIREIVREEVMMSMNKIIAELKSSSNKANVPLVENANKSNKIRYTSNSVLNDILNDTVGGIPQDGTSQESILQESYKGLTSPQPINGTEMLNSFGKNVRDIDDKTKDALTRDYSGLMKVINNKSGK